MARSRNETLGALGRNPARTDKLPKTDAPGPRPTPSGGGDPERGAVARWLHDALFANLGLKFVSLVLACTVYLLVNSDAETERLLTFGVHYTLPDDKVLVSPQVTEVHVRVKGPQRKVDAIDKSQLDLIELDLHDEAGGEVPVPIDKIDVPKGIAIVSVTPKFVGVALEKRVEKTVEITPTLSGHPQHGYIVAEAKTTPATIKVRGAESALRGLVSVRTREFSLNDRDETGVFPLDGQLIAPTGVELEGPNAVSVQLRIEEELVTKKFPGTTVKLRPATDGLDLSKWTLTPQIEVALTGTLLAVEKAKEAMTLFAKVTAADVSAAAQKDGGKREVEVQIDGLPPGIGVKLSPERVRLVQNPAR